MVLRGKNTTLKSGDQPFLGDRVITIGTNTDATISGLILKNGCTRDGIPGGAIFFEGNELIVDSCTFINNEANNSGGAIASCGKNVTITNCVFDETASSEDMAAQLSFTTAAYPITQKSRVL